jgi:UDP-N-acetylmuramoyl-L-alanyl-D-glutamate--2,6-diaminopimelate ligase
MTLRHLAAALEGARAIGSLDREIAAIAYDSRSVRPGALFVALRGARVDGADFVADALARGATAVALDAEHAARLLPFAVDATALVVPDETLALARLAATFYGAPSEHMTVVGVTGTNGKTTTTALVAAVLSAAGMPAGRIGTLGAHFADAMWPLENTTPPAAELQALLEAMRERGARAAALEVSSHALALGRVADVRFAIGALTNVTRDHLDFHENDAAYAAAKRRLFDLAERAVLNADDPYGRRWATELRDAGGRVVTYGFDERSDVRGEVVEAGPNGSTFRVEGCTFRLRLSGRFNVSNALAALAIARSLEVDDATSAVALADAQPLPGRMERIGEGRPAVLVDYAHTPDALEAVLRAAREFGGGRVHVVFGCGGDRDRGKRPLMGRVASELADRITVTSDNPRTESPSDIAAAIVAGIAGNADYAIELDRRSAIRRAVLEAADPDIVLVAGKGHEAYQIVGRRSAHFDDAHEVRAALARRAAGRAHA